MMRNEGYCRIKIILFTKNGKKIKLSKILRKKEEGNPSFILKIFEKKLVIDESVIGTPECLDDSC